ncbi:hypothetical protein J5TS2_23500 [Brevibacillus halotolerans]|nr:hypothetical protein J5TS2_23500 [Brevibacillus halotolerans]
MLHGTASSVANSQTTRDETLIVVKVLAFVATLFIAFISNVDSIGCIGYRHCSLFLIENVATHHKKGLDSFYSSSRSKNLRHSLFF